MNEKIIDHFINEARSSDSFEYAETFGGEKHG